MLTLLVALLASLPSAHADEVLRARCLALLSAYEDPASEAEWRSLGGGASAELLAIAQDATLSHTKRANAIVALGWFPTDTSKRWLATLLASDATESLFRRKAVYALANGYGDAALPELTSALSAPDALLRAAAAAGLEAVGTPAADRALRARLPVEQDRVVLRRIHSAVGRE